MERGDSSYGWKLVVLVSFLSSIMEQETATFHYENIVAVTHLPC
jgi:hypothetical protein